MKTYNLIDELKQLSCDMEANDQDPHVVDDAIVRLEQLEAEVAARKARQWRTLTKSHYRKLFEQILPIRPYLSWHALKEIVKATEDLCKERNT